MDLTLTLRFCCLPPPPFTQFPVSVLFISMFLVRVASSWALCFSGSVSTNCPITVYCVISDIKSIDWFWPHISCFTQISLLGCISVDFRLPGQLPDVYVRWKWRSMRRWRLWRQLVLRQRYRNVHQCVTDFVVFYFWENRSSAFSALTLLVGRQEEHPAYKNWLMRCWCGYLSGARCRLFAYGPADATASWNPIVSCLI